MTTLPPPPLNGVFPVATGPWKLCGADITQGRPPLLCHLWLASLVTRGSLQEGHVTSHIIAFNSSDAADLSLTDSRWLWAEEVAESPKATDTFLYHCLLREKIARHSQN